MNLGKIFINTYLRLITIYLSLISTKEKIEKPTLTALAIEINSACNRRCPWCPNNGNNRDIAFLDKNLFYKVIDELKGMKFKGKITFNHFNEPLLDKRLLEFIAYIRKSIPSSHIYLNTNGDLLTMDLWKRLRKAGLDYANISQYDGKINNNVKDILNNLYPKERKCFDVIIFNTKNICNRAGLVNINGKLKKPLKRYCSRLFYQLCINYKGKVVLCCNDYHGEVEIGDASRDSIKSLWESSTFVEYRRKLAKGDRAGLKLCSRCDM